MARKRRHRWERRQPGRSVDQCMTLAQDAHQAGDTAAAEALYRQALETAPDLAPVWHNLGLALLQQARPAEAEPCLERAARLQPDMAQAWYHLALARLRLGRPDDSLAAGERALSLRPEHADTLNNLGLAHLDKDHGHRAVDAFSRALALAPDNAGVRYNLARALHRVDRGGEAEGHYLAALEQDPKLAGAWNNLGNIHLERKDHKEAVACFRRAVAVQPGAADYWANLAAALVLSGSDPYSLDLAKDAAQRSLDIAPTGHAHYRMAQALLRQDREDEAEAHLRAGLECDPGDRYGAALLLARLGRAPKPERASPTFVRELYDLYAHSFDDHLRTNLRYAGPELLQEAVLRVLSRDGASPPSRNLRVLDLGCGTGLCGVSFREMARELHGVDLSPRMIDKAEVRGIYDRLEADDLVAHLEAAERPYDLLLAADVLIYLGDLAPLFRAARRALVPGGMLALTTERHDPADCGDGYVLAEGNRFAHSPAYVETTAREAGLSPLLLEDCCLREQNREPVPGLLGIFARGR